LRYCTKLPDTPHYIQPKYKGVRQHLLFNKKWYLTESNIPLSSMNLDLNTDYIFDVIVIKNIICIVDLVDSLLTQRERFEILKKIPSNKFLFIADYRLVNNEFEARQQHWINLWNKYEGSVFRPIDSMYSPFSQECFYVCAEKIWAVIIDCFLLNNIKYWNCKKMDGKQFLCMASDWDVQIGNYIQVLTGGLDKDGVPINPSPVKIF
jgi:hypothetical protein